MRRVLLVLLLACGAAWASEEGEGGQKISVEMWKWINFGILAAGIAYLAVKVGKPTLQQRREDILEDLKAAEARGKAAEQKAAEVERRIASLQTEVAQLKDTARAEMQAEAVRIENETKEVLAKVERSSQTEIAAAGKEAVKKLRAEAADLALKLAQQKITQRLDGPAQAALVEQFVTSMRGEESKN